MSVFSLAKKTLSFLCINFIKLFIHAFLSSPPSLSINHFNEFHGICLFPRAGKIACLKKFAPKEEFHQVSAWAQDTILISLISKICIPIFEFALCRQLSPLQHH